jgi:YbgC/YbaW family acyl-CoA thioester hydrolase
MSFEFHNKRRIEFAETDVAGIVHFSNYFRFMEETEHQFLRSLGLTAHGQVDGRNISWPRMRAECSYKAPLCYEEVVDIHLRVREKTKRTITYDFEFAKPEGLVVAQGTVTVICASVDPVTKKLSSITMPKSFDEKIEQAP